MPVRNDHAVELPATLLPDAADFEEAGFGFCGDVGGRRQAALPRGWRVAGPDPDAPGAVRVTDDRGRTRVVVGNASDGRPAAELLGRFRIEERGPDVHDHVGALLGQRRLVLLDGDRVALESDPFAADDEATRERETTALRGCLDLWRPAHDLVAAYWDDHDVGVAAKPPWLDRSLTVALRMPVRLSPSREAFVALGFAIGREVGADGRLAATLPKDWSVDESDPDLVRDARGRPRGRVTAVPGGITHAELLRRYEVGVAEGGTPEGRRLGLGLGRACVVLRDASRAVRAAGEFRADDAARRAADLASMAAWLLERRPDAGDPCAYWSEAAPDL